MIFFSSNPLTEFFKHAKVHRGEFLPDSTQSGYNPGSNWFDNIWSTIASIPIILQEMATSIGNSIGEFFSGLWNNIYNFFKDLPSNISNIWNSFKELLQYINPWSDKFFLKIAFVLSEEQQQIHTNNQEEFKQAFNNKFPFVNSLVDIFQNVQIKQANLRNKRSFDTNPLNLSIGSFSYDSGVISYNTPSTDLSFILEKYEPYRVQVRDGLKLIIYGLGVVYLVKYILNYGITEGANLGISSISSNRKSGDD